MELVVQSGKCDFNSLLSASKKKNAIFKKATAKK